MKRRVICFLCFLVCIFFIAGCNKKQPEEKQTLTIGIIDSTPQFEKYIESFKEKHPEYEVVIKDYRYYEGNNIIIQDFVNDLMIDIAAGTGPDVISWGEMYTHEYAVNNAFIDLMPYVEERLSEEECFVNILKSFAVRDKLYIVSPNFLISTMIAQPSMTKDIPIWDIEHLMSCYEQNRNSSYLCVNHSRDQVVNTFLRGEYNSFVNWETGKCDFGQEKFVNILKFAKQFPEKAFYGDEKHIDEMWKERQYFCWEINACDEFFISELNVRLGEENYRLMGWPSDEGGQHLSHVYRYAYSISAACDNLEIAYQFLDGMFEREFQATISENELAYPVLKEVLYDKLNEAAQVEYIENENGELEPVIRHQWYYAYDTPSFNCVYQITESEREELLSMIESVEESYLVDYSIREIVMEEVQSFLAEDKAIDDVVNIINKRVQIYMSEQY